MSAFKSINEGLKKVYESEGSLKVDDIAGNYIRGNDLHPEEQAEGEPDDSPFGEDEIDGFLNSHGFKPVQGEFSGQLDTLVGKVYMTASVLSNGAATAVKTEVYDGHDNSWEAFLFKGQPDPNDAIEAAKKMVIDWDAYGALFRN